MNRYSFLILLLLSACSSGDRHAKNAILFIGDGMGPTIVTATRYQTKGANGNLNLDTAPHTALVKTYAVDHVVTDSASAATAMASGVKTKMGFLGLTPDLKPVENLMELAKKKKKGTGIVTTTEITHATPAAFYAHHKDRRATSEIASFIEKSDIDLYLGGGWEEVKGALSKNFSKKYHVIRFASQLVDAIQNTKPIFGIFSEKGHLPFEFERNKDVPSLTDMTIAAIQKLKSNSNGFLLVVEGGRIDHALHGNRVDIALSETVEFDRAIGEALKLIENDSDLRGNTLVLAVADHDTGGISFNGYFDHGTPLFQKKLTKEDPKVTLVKHYKGVGASYPILRFATGPKDKAIRGMTEASHTGVDVPLYAWGASSSQIHGTIENTEIFFLLKDALRL